MCTGIFGSCSPKATTSKLIPPKKGGYNGETEKREERQREWERMRERKGKVFVENLYWIMKRENEGKMSLRWQTHKIFLVCNLIFFKNINDVEIKNRANPDGWRGCGSTATATRNVAQFFSEQFCWCGYRWKKEASEAKVRGRETGKKWKKEETDTYPLISMVYLLRRFSSFFFSLFFFGFKSNITNFSSHFISRAL